MTDIFQEVDQSLREDKLGKFWKKYSILFYAAIVLLIGAVGALEFMRWQRDSEIEQQARIFDAATTALGKPDLAGARMAFLQLGERKGGFGAIANHMLANVEQKLSNDPSAIDKALAGAAATDKGLLGDLAILKAGYARADTVDLAELEQALDPLLRKGSYAGALARELIAARALAMGDVARARTEYQALTFELEAPQQMKQRAQQTLMTLPAAPAVPAPAAASPAAPAAPIQPAATPQ